MLHADAHETNASRRTAASVMQRRGQWLGSHVTSDPRPQGQRLPRLLLLSDYRPREADTVIDHIEAIRRWSRYDVFVLPISGDLPDELDLQAFDGLVIHYNLVITNPNYLAPLARWRISRFRGVKAVFVQDEYRFVNSTVAVMRTLGINVLFTCVPEDQVEMVYPRDALPDLKRKVTVLTGYVPERLLSMPVLPYADRPIDVGYRGRRLAAWLGRLGQDKANIADRFLAAALASGLHVDISTREQDRLYGTEWVEFVRRSKAMLGVESGASVFDFDGSIERAVRSYLAAHPYASFDELHRRFLAEVDGRIRLNQISPRCFEAAALGTLMVLYPGEYSGILRPWQHYVPLQKDHSNMGEVVDALRDRTTWERITRSAREDVALNPRYSFQAMSETVDRGLDLTSESRRPIDPARFERLASTSFARLRTTQLHAFGLPPGINRLRIQAFRALRALRPSPIAMSPDPSTTDVGWLRKQVRYVRSLLYWAARPDLLPWARLLSDRPALLRDLGVLGRLQAMGALAVKAGTDSPFVVLFHAANREVRIVLRGDSDGAVAAAHKIPNDLSWATTVRLDLGDPWLVPVGLASGTTHSIESLSRLIRVRPDVVRNLLIGPARWCDVVVDGSAGGWRVGSALDS